MLMRLFLSISLLGVLQAAPYERESLAYTNSYDFTAAAIRDDLSKLIADSSAPAPLVSSGDLPLFKAHPALMQHISHITLGDLPTPVMHCRSLGQRIGIANFFIKDDGKSGMRTGQGRLFGGNKVRKLEFLLADAYAQGASCIMTMGAAGSNHAIATAVYANMLGLKTVCFLRPQKNSLTVRRNLLLHQHYGTDVRFCPTVPLLRFGIISEFLYQKQITNKFPYFIPTGGSCARGVIGFVNAVFELKEQIDAGMLPEPDRIYVACGSAGTAAGLLLGIKAAGLKSTLVAVAVEASGTVSTLTPRIVNLARETQELLAHSEPSYAALDIQPDNLVILEGYAGTGYGIFTPAAVDAMALVHETEGIYLDGTYTGKAFAGMLVDGAQYANQVLLFWNTYCGDDFADVAAQVDYKKLPAYFHTYFETPVQDQLF